MSTPCATVATITTLKRDSITSRGGSVSFSIVGSGSISYGGETWEGESTYTKRAYLNLDYLQIGNNGFTILDLEASLLEGGHQFKYVTLTPYKLWNLSASLEMDWRNTTQVSASFIASVADVDDRVLIPWGEWDIVLFGTIHVAGIGKGFSAEKSNGKFSFRITPAFLGFGYSVGIDAEYRG